MKLTYKQKKKINRFFDKLFDHILPNLKHLLIRGFLWSYLILVGMYCLINWYIVLAIKEHHWTTTSFAMSTTLGLISLYSYLSRKRIISSHYWKLVFFLILFSYYRWNPDNPFPTMIAMVISLFPLIYSMYYLGFKDEDFTMDVIDKKYRERRKKAKIKRAVISTIRKSQATILDRYYKKGASLNDVLAVLAPGTPVFNEETRSSNPIAYHKYTIGKNYTFYVMEYILEDNYLWFWGYEIDKSLENINLCSWYRSIGMQSIVDTMKKDPNFKPAHALDIPEIGKEWISKDHDSKRDHLAGDYAKKYYEVDQPELIKDLATYYQHQGEKLDLQYQRQIYRN